MTAGAPERGEGRTAWRGPRAPFPSDEPEPGGGGDEAEGDRVAEAPILRRLQVIALVYGVGLGAALGAMSGARRGLVLTGGAAVSIVALRSLEGVVRRLGASGREPPAGLGWRYPFRLLLLVVLVTLLVLVGRDPLALVLGVSAVPAALLAEAALQLVRLRSKPRPSPEREP